jgi:hypothetical protein
VAEPIFAINQNILFNGVISASASLVSSSVDISEVFGFCIQAVWAGTSPAGTINVQGSTDNINFNTVTSLSVSGNTGNDLLNFNVAHFRYVQCTFTGSGGTGTLNIQLSAKRL